MDASQGIFGGVRNYFARIWGSSPHSGATAATAAAKSNAATSALASASSNSSESRALKREYYFDVVPAAPDLMIKLAPFLGDKGVLTLSHCSSLAAQRLADQAIAEWARLGVIIPQEVIDKIPAPPDESQLKENEFLVLIPKGLTLNHFKGKLRYIDYKVECNFFGHIKQDSSYWVAVPKEVLDGSRRKTFSDQVQLMNEKCPGGQVPTLIEAISISLIYKERTGERLLGANPLTYTCCLEQINGYQTSVGGFCTRGLAVDYDFLHWDFPNIVLLPLRKFSSH